MKIAALVPNLMDRSRFGSSNVIFVKDFDELATTGAELALVDVDRCGQVPKLTDMRVIGFGSHVDLDEVPSDLFDELLARSAFFRRLPEILQAAGEQ